jgi:DUF438 domain-containing protein
MRYKSTKCAHNAIELLTRDQDVISELFRDYERLLQLQDAAVRKEEIVAQLCLVLKVHLQVQEEILYPAVLHACGSNALPTQILLDHAGIQELVARLLKMLPGNADYDATVAVLNAYVAPHMINEREYVYPTVLKAGLDMLALGLKVHLRQKELYESVAGRQSSSASNAGSVLPLAINIMLVKVG